MSDAPHSAARPASRVRQVGKFGFFLLRGLSPAVAGWLARHDAPKQHDYRRIPTAYLESAWRADPTWRSIEASDGKVRSATLALDFVAHDLAAADYDTLVQLRKRGFAIERSSEGLVIKNNAVRLELTTPEHLSMAKEIYVEGCYDLRLAGDWVVMDIGGNIGLATLFFASQPWVRHVIAYEPFPATYRQHSNNVAANGELAGKVSAENFGLSDHTHTVAVQYDPQWSGSMSVAGLGRWRGVSTDNLQEVEILLQGAADVVSSVRQRFSGLKLLAKIDCEGSEFAIIRDLAQRNLLTAFDAIVMEWHENDPSEMVDALRNAGFGLQIRPLVPERTLGLILAWR